jgi:hypothetical protein
MSHYLVLRRWRVYKSSDSILRRCLGFQPSSILPIVDVDFPPAMQVCAHPKVIEWSKSLESLTKR